MMSNTALEFIITILLGGGLLKGVEAVYRAYSDGKEKKKLLSVVGAKTPVEIESVSIATMAAALTSVESRIKSLVAERGEDLKHHEAKTRMLTDHIKMLEDKIDRLQSQNLKLLSYKLERGGLEHE